MNNVLPEVNGEWNNVEVSWHVKDHWRRDDSRSKQLKRVCGHETKSKLKYLFTSRNTIHGTGKLSFVL
jgi:hypothetical protein